MGNKYLRPIKERLEDIHGEAQAENLIKMEYLDNANLLRLDERLQAVSTNMRSSDIQKSLLYETGKSIEQAKSQTERMQILNEESQTLRRLIRSLNTIFIAIMEGNLSPFSNDFKKIIFEQTKYMDLIDALKPVFDMHVLLKYGEQYHNSLIESKRTGVNYRFCMRNPGTFAEPSVAMEQALCHLSAELQRRDIEQIEESMKNHCLNGFQRAAKLVPLERSPYSERWEALQQNLKTLITPLYDLKAVCILLQKPENHIKVASKQLREKKVPLRTEADMTREMARKLISLSKYTAYAKAQKIAKIKTRTLPHKEEPISKFFWDVLISFYYESFPELDRRLKERREKWKEYVLWENHKMVEDSEPPTPNGYSQGKGADVGSVKAPVVERDGPPPVSHR